MLKKGAKWKRVDNKREYIRRTSYIIAEYAVREGTFRDVIKNLGASGLFVRTDRKISVDQSITLKFPLFEFDEIIEVSGKIIRAEQSGFTVSFFNPIEDLISENGQFPQIVHEADRPSK